MNQLILKFNAVECNGWPKIRVLLDLDIFESYQFTTQQAELTLPIDLFDGEHLLSIEVYGKEHRNTILNSTGDIVNDQLVSLTEMIVDGITLPDYYKWQGIYCDDLGEHPQSLTWGRNGTWKWEFATPLVTWLITKKIENEEKHNPPEISYEERLQIVRTKIKKIEEQLDQL